MAPTPSLSLYPVPLRYVCSTLVRCHWGFCGGMVGQRLGPHVATQCVAEGPVASALTMTVVPQLVPPSPQEFRLFYPRWQRRPRRSHRIFKKARPRRVPKTVRDPQPQHFRISDALAQVNTQCCAFDSSKSPMTNIPAQPRIRQWQAWAHHVPVSDSPFRVSIGHF